MSWWNSGGVYFLSLYGAVAGGALVVSLAARAAVWRRRGRAADRPPGAVDLAYLKGGFHLAAVACAVGLYRKGAINRGPASVLDVTGPVPAGAPPLMVAIHTRLREPASWPQALADGEVRAAAEALHRKLVGRGLLAPTCRSPRRSASTPSHAGDGPGPSAGNTAGGSRGGSTRA